MKKRQRGFTLHEAIGALFIAAMLTMGLSTMINTSLDDTKAQQAALHQAQVVSAASKYIAANYDVISGTATATNPHIIQISDLRDAGSLSAGFANTNAYGQTPCVLVLQPAAKKFDVLIVTEGGNPIPDKNIAFVSANAGQGGGYINSTDSATGEALGAFGSWRLTQPRLGNFLSGNCTSTAADVGHLSSALFFDGPGRPAEFLYRDEIPDNMHLNRMTTALGMGHVVTIGATDSLCTSDEPKTDGNIAVAPISPTDSRTVLVTCQLGRWARYGSGSWKESVAGHAHLPVTGNTAGDVRMVRGGVGANRAFTWNGSSWVALAVDQNGLLTANLVQLNSVVSQGAACTSNGLIARDVDGLVMSCQNNVWSHQSVVELGYSERGCRQMQPSKFNLTEANCLTKYNDAFFYMANVDTYGATITRDITVVKSGLISVNAWSQMNRGLVDTSQYWPTGQLALYVVIRDRNNGAVLASTQSQSAALSNSSAGLNISLSKAVPRTDAGYSVEITTYYSLFDGGARVFDEANFYNQGTGTVVQQTPLMTGWNIDVYY